MKKLQTLQKYFRQTQALVHVQTTTVIMLCSDRLATTQGEERI